MKLSNNRKMALFSLLFLAAFTSKSFAWTVSADFEQGTVGQQAEGTSGLNDAFTQTLYSNETASSGTKSAKLSWSSGSDAWGVDGGRLDYPSKIGEGSELWARGYFYFKSPWSWKSNPVVKVLRAAHVMTSGGSHIGYLSVFSDTNGKIVMSNEVGDYQDWSPTVSFDTDKWQCIEMYVKLSATSPIFRIWKNGVLVKEDKTYKTLKSSSDVADFSYIFTYWNGGVPQNQVSYMDDFVYTTTRPSKTDAYGNYMIGPIDGTTPASTVPSAPGDLIVK